MLLATIDVPFPHDSNVLSIYTLLHVLYVLLYMLSRLIAIHS